MKKKIIYGLAIILFTICGYSFLNYNIINNTETYSYLKKKIPPGIKKEIRSKFSSLVKYLNKDKIKLAKLDIKNNEILGNIKGYNNKLFNFTGPRAYLGTSEKNLFLITGNGLLYQTEISTFDQKKDVLLKEIKTNILRIFKNYRIDNTDELERSSMVKSILIHKDTVYISATVKVNENCYKQKIFSGKVNLKKIHFNEFFQIRDCRTFYNDTSGGNIVYFKDNKILYTLGDWKTCQYLHLYPKNFCEKKGPQNLKSTFGKILSIDLDTKKFEFISTGHNNPQGITFNKNRNIIFSAEHGPQGGDEVNVNDLSENKNKIKNFGWPIASYGEHYGYPAEDIMHLYDMAPLYKSHKAHGFIEPLDYFVPSIGISDIVSYKDKLFVASMGSSADQGDLSLYVYDLDKNNNIINKNKIFFDQRIRDLHIVGHKLFMFLESTGTVTVVNLNNLNLK